MLDSSEKRATRIGQTKKRSNKSPRNDRPKKAVRSVRTVRTALALIALLVIALIALFVPPFTASDLWIVPDSVEYATAAWRLVNEGQYAITINGEAYPPRYSPGFALFALAPAYILFGQNPGNAIFGVLIWSLVGVSAAFAIGRRIGGTPGGLMAGSAVLLLPHYRHYSHVIMSDATCAAAILVLLLLYLRLASSPDTWRGWLGAGALAAVVASIRPTGLSASLPFLLLALRIQPRRLALRKALIFLGPILLFAILQMTYNFRAFGSLLRSGYQFWCPVPYDYPELTFGFSFVPLNFMAAWRSGLVALLAAVVIMILVVRKEARRDDQSLQASRDALLFTLLAALPLSLFHMFYFFSDPRFFLPVTGPIAAVVGAVGCATLLRNSNRVAPIAVGLALCLVLVLESMRPAAIPTRRLAVDSFDAILPKKALLISHIDPVYLDFFLNRDAERVVLPISRYVEYASKIAAPSRIETPDPPPVGELDHRCPGLLNGGGVDIIGATVSEPAGLDAIDDALAAGIPVFVDATHLDPAELYLTKRLPKRYRMESTAQLGLYRLSR